MFLQFSTFLVIFDEKSLQMTKKMENWRNIGPMYQHFQLENVNLRPKYDGSSCTDFWSLK